MKRGQWIALIAWSIALFGGGYTVGLATTPGQVFWDLAYSPSLPAVIAILVTVVLWYLDRGRD